MMKMYLLQKQTIKENYRYFISMLLMTVFLILMFHVSISSPDHANNIFLTSLFIALILSYSVLTPTILFKNLYHETNVHHISSIPMTRMEMFVSQYLVGIVFGLLLILSYSSFTILVIGTQSSWIFQTTCLIVLFLFYHHLSLLAYWICGNKLFYGLMVLFFSFGPLLFYFVFTWIMQSYVFGYVYSELAFLNVEILLPVSSIVLSIFGETTVNYHLLFLTLSMMMLVLTMIAVRYRHHERTGQSISFKVLSLLIRLAISALGIGLLISFVATVSDYDIKDDGSAMLFSCILISIIVVYLIEMIYKKNSKVFYTIKYAILIGVCGFGSTQIAANYLKYYTPNDIESVYIYTSDSVEAKDRYFEITDENSIQKVKELQKRIIDGEDVWLNKNSYNVIRLSYNTTSGNQSNRDYPISYHFAKTYLPEYLKDQQIFDAFTYAEQELIERLDQNIFFDVYLSGDTYHIDTKEKCYLFKNYLKQELENINHQPSVLIEDEFKDDDSYCYLEITKLTSKQDQETFRIFGDNQRIYRALNKTFNLVGE